VRRGPRAANLADALIVEFALAADVSSGVGRVADLLRASGRAAGVEWWAPSERGSSLALKRVTGSREGRRTAVSIGPAGTLVLVDAASVQHATRALNRLAPVLRRRWTEERLAHHASLLARRIEALDDFAALVAHELKAPLQAALRATDPASGAAAALELVESVLEAVRSEDAAEVSASPVKCLESALRDLGPTDAEVVSRLLPDTFPMPPEALRLVLRNLLGNALAARARRIRVSVVAAPTQSILLVDDDGVGLDASDRYATGNRLGLSLCGRLAARLGGVLELRPRAAGGTRATLAISRR
jgi:signal transduction histidine kinase